MKHFEVIVIGGGHAGAEAAYAAARLGARTALVTLDRQKTGAMSCNPAIGGLGKGHLVREIDAMGGLMGLAADMAGIQYRLLNRSRGRAVQGPRVQADRKLYRQAVQALLASEPLLDVIEGEVVGLKLSGNAVTGVHLADGSQLGADAVVLTTGTFLNGVIHIGDRKSSGGRVGDKASQMLAAQLREISPRVGRLKTGTPPRLDGRTIDWAALELQAGDDQPFMMSFMNHRPAVPQVSCGITHTNEETHDIIRKNLSKSAMYGGHIEGVGPRYCPSIEDKVTRFSDKSSHQVFLEPEGLDDHTVYPNGISSSLPEDVQVEYVRSIAGLSDVQILQPGYAIEYDYFDPRDLEMSLQHRSVRGLYFAGQLNGTTGYEEAAAQGLVAGFNAALAALRLPALGFDRSTSYIGVMVDDLICRGVSEPYRMFTSRAEHRLAIRADNADRRLTPIAISIGAVKPDRRVGFEQKLEALEKTRSALESRSFTPQDLAVSGISVRCDGRRRTALELLATSEIDAQRVLALDDAFGQLGDDEVAEVTADATYAPYLARMQGQLDAMNRDATVAISPDFDYRSLLGLSTELRQKLTATRPATLAHAARIEGMTAAALALLHLRVRASKLDSEAV